MLFSHKCLTLITDRSTGHYGSGRGKLSCSILLKDAYMNGSGLWN